jgi:teichuronic acid biosynthesis glycosyltransferase TuaG
MFISVITTCFNSKNTIFECIASVKLLGSENYEHLIIDDGSTDDTDDFINNLCDKNIVYIKFPKIGRAKALNIGIRAAKGDYVCILDSDDLLLAKNLTAITDFLLTDMNLYESADVVSGNVLVSDIDFKIKISSYDFLPDYYIPRNFLYYIMNPIPHVGVLIKRKSINLVCGYNEKRRSQLDWDLWHRIILKGMNVYKFSSCVGVKRIHNNQSFENVRHFRYVVSGVYLTFRYAILSKNPCNILIAFVFGFLRMVWAYVPRDFRVGFWRKGTTKSL